MECMLLNVLATYWNTLYSVLYICFKNQQGHIFTNNMIETSKIYCYKHYSNGLLIITAKSFLL